MHDEALVLEGMSIKMATSNAVDLELRGIWTHRPFSNDQCWRGTWLVEFPMLIQCSGFDQLIKSTTINRVYRNSC